MSGEAAAVERQRKGSETSRKAAKCDRKDVEEAINETMIEN